MSEHEGRGYCDAHVGSAHPPRCSACDAEWLAPGTIEEIDFAMGSDLRWLVEGGDKTLVPRDPDDFEHRILVALEILMNAPDRTAVRGAVFGTLRRTGGARNYTALIIETAAQHWVRWLLAEAPHEKTAMFAHVWTTLVAAHHAVAPDRADRPRLGVRPVEEGAPDV